MSFKEFLRKACTVGLSASMLFGCFSSQVNAEDSQPTTSISSSPVETTLEVEGTVKGKLVTIDAGAFGKIRIQLFSNLKYNKVKQRLIDFVANQLGGSVRLWLRYTFTNVEGNLKETSDWVEYVGDATLSNMIVKEDGKYDIHYIVTHDVKIGS